MVRRLVFLSLLTLSVGGACTGPDIVRCTELQAREISLVDDLGRVVATIGRKSDGSVAIAVSDQGRTYTAGLMVDQTGCGLQLVADGGDEEQVSASFFVTLEKLDDILTEADPDSSPLRGLMVAAGPDGTLVASQTDDRIMALANLPSLRMIAAGTVIDGDATRDFVGMGIGQTPGIVLVKDGVELRILNNGDETIGLLQANGELIPVFALHSVDGVLTRATSTEEMSAEQIQALADRFEQAMQGAGDAGQRFTRLPRFGRALGWPTR